VKWGFYKLWILGQAEAFIVFGTLKLVRARGFDIVGRRRKSNM